MSAYVVDPEIINRILAALDGFGDSGHWCLEYPALAALKGAQGTTLDQEMLGAVMYMVNIDSVRARYGNSEGERLPGSVDPATGQSPAPYEYHLEPQPKLVQTYKDIGCWIYQSCESEECCGHPVFKALDVFRAKVADAIIRNLPEYQTATWG